MFSAIYAFKQETKSVRSADILHLMKS